MAHIKGTGPEIWNQTGKNVDVFLAAAGSGGTISGCSQYLKSMNPDIKVYLVDPVGSGFFNYVKTHSIVSEENHHGLHTRFLNCERSGWTVAEGIGGKRMTKNFEKAQIDGAIYVSDQEMIEMLYYLQEHEDLSVGPSAALNVAAAVKLAEKIGEGHTIVTILCDGGERYKSKL